MLSDLCTAIGPNELEEKFRFDKALGEGSFGQVFRARHVSGGSNVALKVIKKRAAHSPRFLKRVGTEISILKKMKHKNIVRLHSAMDDERHFYIVTDLCKNGDLLDWIKSGNNTSELAALQVLEQALEALAYLHSKGVAHRDIKLENIGISGDRVQLIDFGLSSECEFGELKTEIRGSDGYLAPEMVSERPAYCPRAADVWAMGVVLYELLTWDRKNLMDRRLLEDVSQGTVQLLEQMLRLSPWKRLTAKEALSFISENIELTMERIPK